MQLSCVLAVVKEPAGQPPHRRFVVAVHATRVKKPGRGGQASEHVGHAVSTAEAVVEGDSAAAKVPAAHTEHERSAVAVARAL